MARDTFPSAIAYVLAHEGGYVNDPKDKGGPTNLGITLATLSAWRGTEVSAIDVQSLGRPEATAIYRAKFWDRIRAALLPTGLDYAMFDFAVNSGAGRAARFLQTLLKARKLYAGEIDGGIGAKTLEALAKVTDVARLIGDLSAMRLKYLRTLDGWGRFGKGWARRVAEVQAASVALANGSTPTFGIIGTNAVPVPAPSSRGVGATVAVSRTLPGKAAILSVASAVGEQAFEYATTISALQDIAPVFKWAFAILTVIGIVAGLAKAIQLAQGKGNGDIPTVPRAARAPDPVGAPIAAQPAEADPGPEAPAEPAPEPAIPEQSEDLPELPAEPEPAPVEAPTPEPVPSWFMAAFVLAAAECLPQPPRPQED
ncbi:MAG: glycoside hydrolase family 108 protein [Actinomycetospora chiangmaiensis]|nr:glycoside hydrolase family 108 protein [Actinomycetospora chiangmaiensis]